MREVLCPVCCRIFNLQCADFFKDFLEPFEVVFFSREEVRISGWPMGLVCPKLEEQRTLQNECISIRRLAYAVQNPLQRVFGQKKIEVLFLALARLRRRCFADAAVLVEIALFKSETPYTAA
jgi:hypothetical protein